MPAQNCSVYDREIIFVHLKTRVKCRQEALHWAYLLMQDTHPLLMHTSPMAAYLPWLRA